MAIGDDFSVSRSTGNIRHVSGTSTYTVLQFHRWLQDLADDATSSGNDELDITDPTPSERSTDNIITLLGNYNIDDDAAEYLYNGSIQQDGGNTLYSGLVVVGSVASTTTLKVIQDNAFYDSQSAPFWTTITDNREDPANNILLRALIKTRVNGADIDGKRIRVQARTYTDTSSEFSVTMGLGNSTAAIFTNDDLNNQTAAGTVATWTINNTEGYQQIDINNDSVDENYYSSWDRVSSAGGAGNINDIYEYAKYIQRDQTAETIHGINGELFRGITHSMDYDGESGGPFTEDEILVWGTGITYDTLVGGTFTEGNYVTIGSNNAAGKIVYDSGTTQMTVALEDTSITLLNNDVITEYSVTGGATGVTAAINVTITDNDKSGGEGILLALNDAGTTGELFIQLITGNAPVDNLPIRGRTSGATALVNGVVTARTIEPCFLGTSTGSNLIGAYGIGVVTGDTSVGDQYFDLDDNGPILPPNNQSFFVTTVVSGEDRILVGPRPDAVTDNFNFDQFTTDVALSGGEATIAIETGAGAGDETTIKSDTPVPGQIRVQDTNGVYQVVTYTGFTTTSFTGCSGTPATNLNANIFIGYIDKLATGTSENFTAVYNADRLLWVRVRDGGGTPIKTFETGSTYGAGGGSVSAIRTSDS